MRNMNLCLWRAAPESSQFEIIAFQKQSRMLGFECRQAFRSILHCADDQCSQMCSQRVAENAIRGTSLSCAQGAASCCCICGCALDFSLTQRPLLGPLHFVSLRLRLKQVVAVQNKYLEQVESMAEKAAKVLQMMCIEFHSSRADMNALMLAHELNEIGSTLCQVAVNSTEQNWSLPIMEGAFFSAGCQCAGFPAKNQIPVFCNITSSFSCETLQFSTAFERIFSFIAAVYGHGATLHAPLKYYQFHLELF
jgi:hypothetical protein